MIEYKFNESEEILFITLSAILVGERLSGGNYILKAFSTEEFALHWLRIA